MKVLNFGSINIDMLYSVPHIVKPGETIHSSSLKVSAGGKGANQSVALSKAGLEVWHGGTIGQDGQWLCQLLKDFDVKTDFIRQYDGATGQAIIQISDEGQNSIFLYGGGNKANSTEHIDNTLSNFSEGDYLVLQNEINHNGYIIEQALKKEMRICLNPAPYTQDVNQWPINDLEFLIVNEIEAEELAGISGSYSQVLNELTEKYPKLKILLTAGEDGAYYGCGKEREFTPAVKVKAVDTTAAGDTFFGYFLASYIKGFTILESMKKASLASSITVTKEGAMESIPYESELVL